MAVSTVAYSRHPPARQQPVPRAALPETGRPFEEWRRTELATFPAVREVIDHFELTPHLADEARMR